MISSSEKLILQDGARAATTAIIAMAGLAIACVEIRATVGVAGKRQDYLRARLLSIRGSSRSPGSLASETSVGSDVLAGSDASSLPHATNARLKPKMKNKPQLSSMNDSSPLYLDASSCTTRHTIQLKPV